LIGDLVFLLGLEDEPVRLGCEWEGGAARVLRLDVGMVEIGL